jgi:hypothetical protein
MTSVFSVNGRVVTASGDHTHEVDGVLTESVVGQYSSKKGAVVLDRLHDKNNNNNNNNNKF